MSYRQISRSLETARLDFIMIASHWNLTGLSATLLPKCLSNFRAIRKVTPRGLETSRNHAVRRPCAQWAGGMSVGDASKWQSESWWRHQMETYPRYWPFVRGIHWSPLNSPHKGQWRGALMFSLICAWINGWVSYRGAGNLRRHIAHHDVTVM